MSKPFDQPMPANVEAERMVLGCALLDNRTFAQARDGGLMPEDFFFAQHGTIYRAMLALIDAKRVIDPIALQEELQRAGRLEDIGGPVVIAGLYDGVPRFSDIRNYVRIVREHSAKRQLLMVNRQLTNATFDGEMDVRELLAMARREIEAIADPEGIFHWRTAQTALRGYLDSVEARLASGKRYDGMATGLSDLDEELWGLPLGTVTLVAARPGMGKTSLLMQIAEEAAASPHNDDVLCVFFSLEMPAEQLVQRALAARAQMAVRGLRTLTSWRREAERQALQEASDAFGRLPLLIQDTPGLTPGRFLAEIRRIQHEYPKRPIIAFVDYLQLMQPDERGLRSSYDKATEISKMLANATRECGCCTIAAAQLNRDSDKRAGNRPTISDLRDSGQQEQDAAVILFPHRPAYYDEQRKGSKAIETDAEIIVGKGRFSGAAVVPMCFSPSSVRFLPRDSQATTAHEAETRGIRNNHNGRGASARALATELGW